MPFETSETQNIKAAILTGFATRTFPDVTLPVIPPAILLSKKTHYEHQTSLTNAPFVVALFPQSKIKMQIWSLLVTHSNR
jgi:hypothetical protein